MSLPVAALSRSLMETEPPETVRALFAGERTR
jgi:hypothetical protein